MNLGEQIEHTETMVRLHDSDTHHSILASLRELKRLREVLDMFAFFEGAPMPPEAAQDFARQAYKARKSGGKSDHG